MEGRFGSIAPRRSSDLRVVAAADRAGPRAGLAVVHHLGPGPGPGLGPELGDASSVMIGVVAAATETAEARARAKVGVVGAAVVVAEAAVRMGAMARPRVGVTTTSSRHDFAPCAADPKWLAARRGSAW
jgi:hypothetical protein